MNETERQDIEQTVDILRQLDRTSLLIIDSGAKMLLTRQELADGKEDERNSIKRRTGYVKPDILRKS